MPQNPFDQLFVNKEGQIKVGKDFTYQNIHLEDDGLLKVDDSIAHAKSIFDLNRMADAEALGQIPDKFLPCPTSGIKNGSVLFGQSSSQPTSFSDDFSNFGAWTFNSQPGNCNPNGNVFSSPGTGTLQIKGQCATDPSPNRHSYMFFSGSWSNDQSIVATVVKANAHSPNPRIYGLALRAKTFTYAGGTIFVAYSCILDVDNTVGGTTNSGTHDMLAEQDNGGSTSVSTVTNQIPKIGDVVTFQVVGSALTLSFQKGSNWDLSVQGVTVFIFNSFIDTKVASGSPGFTNDPAPGTGGPFDESAQWSNVTIGVVGAGTLTSQSGPKCNFGQDNSNLFFDSTSHRLGVGTNTPCTTFDVNGNAHISGSLGIRTCAMLAPLDVRGNVRFGGIPTVFYDNTNLRLGIGAGVTPLSTLDVRGNVQFGVQGTGLFWNNANNRLGVGTAAPSDIFHIFAASGVAASVDITTFDSTRTANIILLSSATQKWAFSSRNAVDTPNDRLSLFNTAITEVMTWLQSGNVGIGQTNPAQPLDVLRSVNAATFIHLVNNNAGTSTQAVIQVDNGTSIMNYSQTGTAYTPITIFDRQNAGYLSSNGPGGMALAASNAAGIMTFHTGGNSQRMAIDAAGNVTIAYLAAGSVLFAGAAGLINQNNGNLFWDNTNLAFGVGTTTPATFAAFAVRRSVLLGGFNVSASYSDAVNSTFDIRHAAGLVDLSSETLALTLSAGSAERARITSTGLVGINIATPNVFLDVNGAVASRKLDVALANGANQNVAISTFSTIRIVGPTLAFSIGGFANGFDGRILYLFNSTANALTINNEDVGSLTTNRITTLTGANVTLRTGTSFATFVYDVASGRWILSATN